MVRSCMSFQAKRELLVQVAPRYREAHHGHKCIILDEFVAATGYARKYAIHLLSRPVSPVVPLRRPRERRYGADVQAALATSWAAANYIGAKRLVPFLPELVPVLERHGHLALEAKLRDQLLRLSPATADRILGHYRRQEGQHGIGTTKHGILLKHQVPVRTFADWNEARPGFTEADLVAHCGYHAEGAFLYSLVVTDVATGWIECLPLLYRTQEAVVQALGRIRRLLPMPLLGLDTDNGTEFMNAELIAYCERERLTFTRGRAYKKNDQCFVEQKNGAVVRQLVGYDRFQGERAYYQLNELYRAVRLYVNFFQPSMKLLSKNRDGGRTRKSYEAAQTPFHRLLDTKVLDTESEERLREIYSALDPVVLLRQLEALQDALWRHAVVSPSVSTQGSLTPITATVRFTSGIEAHDNTGTRAIKTAENAARMPPIGHRKYRRAAKTRVLHTWRTRSDPFESVWDEIVQLLTEYPEMTAKSLLSRLQIRHPRQFPANQLRTLQRRVKEWRAQAILQFDDRWLHEEIMAGQTLPRPLHALVKEEDAIVNAAI